MTDSNKEHESYTDSPNYDMDRPEYPVMQKAVVLNEKGIHARPAGKIAMIAKKAESDIVIIKNGQIADATQIMDILCLFCPMGAEIAIAATAPSDRRIVDEITELVNGKFEE